MKTTNITISLDTRKPLKDGSYPVIMRIGHNARTTAVALGIDVQQKDWDSQSKTIKKSYSGVSSVSRLNNLIQKKKTDAMDIILKLHESGELALLSVTGIKEKIVSENKSISFTQFTNQLVEDLIKAKRIGTARSYKCVNRVLKAFNKDKELQFKDVSYAFLLKFETIHKSKGNQANGLAVYMRTIRAIFNKAIHAELVEKELYPFSNYKIKTVPTEKRAIEWESLKKIIALELPSDHTCFNARNYFVTSYMMYGMNFTDMAFLKKEDIRDGRICYRRKKTSKLYDIKITENISRILNHYIQQNDTSEYIFPIIKSESAGAQEKNIQWARKRYNKKLKELALLCGIDKKMTSYVSRHSFATQAMLQQVPLNAISTMLGHSSLKTTEIYLKSLPSNILDEYNSLIVGKVYSS